MGKLEYLQRRVTRRLRRLKAWRITKRMSTGTFDP